MLDTVYKPALRRVGILKQETILSVDMPRARFIEIVNETLDSSFIKEWPVAMREQLRAEIMPVAQAMPRFPLSEWLHKERGCGCVVGEYLVATSELERSQIVEKINETSSIETLLRGNPLHDILAAFGYEIDGEMRKEVFHPDINPKPVSIEIID